MSAATKTEAAALERVREKVEAGERLDAADGLALYETSDLLGLGELAEQARRLRGGGDEVYFVRNLTLNQTNVCRVKCRFCAFARAVREEGAYTLSPAELAAEAKRSYEQEPYNELHLVNGESPQVDFAWYLETIRALLDDKYVIEYRQRALSPDRPVIRGTAQNPDVFFQAREACNPFYDAVPGIVQSVMNRFADQTGRAYHLFDYYGHTPARLRRWHSGPDILLDGAAGDPRATWTHMRVDGHAVALDTDAYIAQLRTGPGFARDLDERAKHSQTSGAQQAEFLSGHFTHDRCHSRALS